MRLLFDIFHSVLLQNISSNLLQRSDIRSQFQAKMKTPIPVRNVSLVIVELNSPNSSNAFVSTLSIQEMYPELVDQLIFQVLFGIVYTVVCVLGVGGNVFVLYSIFYKGLLFNVRRIFISSLACSDIIIGLTSLPITAISTFSRNWLFGTSLCHVIGFIQGSHIFISSFTLIAIAVDRYWLVLRPFSIKVTYGGATRIVILAWISGYLLAMPLAFYVSIKAYPDEEYPHLRGQFCEETWPDELARRVYGIAVLCLQFGLPLTANSVCYIAINKHLQMQLIKRRTSQLLFLDTHRRLLRRRRRTTVMTTMMLLSFVLAWLPMNVLNFARDFSFFEQLIALEHFSILFAFGHLIAMTSIIWNPMIYMGFQQSFREFVAQSTTASCISTMTTTAF